MEQSLDNIADGELNWEKYLNSVYHGDLGLRSLVAREEGNINPDEARTIKLEGLEKYEFHVGKYGAYVKTLRDGESFSASIPDAEAPADVTSATIEKLIEQKLKGADSLGVDPKTGKKIYVLNGRYGAYVQLGENDDEEIKRSTLPPGLDPVAVTYDKSLEILALPKSLGLNPGNGKDIKAGVGRFGPYVVCDGDYRSIPKTETVFGMNLEKALALFAIPKKGRGKAAPLKEFGKHPQHDIEVNLFNGPYGPYLKAGKVNVGLPEDVTADNITKEKAFELMNDKLAEAGTKSKGKAKGKAKKATKAVSKAAKPTDKPEVVSKKKVITKKKK
jgi:DNA topoisomerase-1